MKLPEIKLTCYQLLFSTITDVHPWVNVCTKQNNLFMYFSKFTKGLRDPIVSCLSYTHFSKFEGSFNFFKICKRYLWWINKKSSVCYMHIHSLFKVWKLLWLKIGWKQYIAQNIGSFSACLHVLAPIVRTNAIIVYGHG